MGIINALLLFFIGAIVGLLVGIAIVPTKIIGTLKIDHSDNDDRPYLFLEMNTSLEKLSKKKCVIMKVDIGDYIPHE